MNDDQALQLMVDCANLVDESQHFSIINLDYTIVAVSKHGDFIYGVPAEGTVGMSVLDFATGAIRTLLVKKCLKRCFEQKRVIKFLTMRLSRAKEYRLAIISYYPLINYITGNVIGFKVILQVPDFPLRLYSLPHILSSTLDSHVSGEDESSDFNNNLEDEILYLAFQCENYQEIADLLSLAHGQVISRARIAKIIVRNLFTKYEVFNFNALKDKAHALGYHKKVPLHLFGDFVYPLEKL